MFIVLGNTWALMLGMMLLMNGNGLQGTLIGVRGELEGFTTIELSVVMSAYFVGFLGASRLVPELIRRVGHVRVFCGACVIYFCSFDSLSSFSQSNLLVLWKGSHRLLLLWCLYYGRELVK